MSLDTLYNMSVMKFIYDENAQVTRSEILEEAKKLEEYIAQLIKISKDENYSYDESTINLPLDKTNLDEITRIKEGLVTPKLKYILNIGIGGSNLGTRAIYDALYGYFEIIEPLRFPKMIFADTDDPTFLIKLKHFLKSHTCYPEEVIINTISKSGNTAETITNLEILVSDLPFAKDRLVVITEKDSELYKTTKYLKIRTLEIPKKVGGRFSVFSNVGLFPLACLDINLTELLKGAVESRNAGLQKDVFKNPAVLSAITTFINYKKGKIINNSFFFVPELESLGKWYRQLMAESLGKDGKGITPTVSIGSADLHSMGQLYLGGTRDKYFTFISIENVTEDIIVPEKPVFDILQNLKGTGAKTVMRAFLQGIKTAYKDKGIPFSEIKLKNLNERSLGNFLQFKMMEIMYLGKLMGVNAFDQPNVEEYKTEVRKLLNLT